MIVYMRASMTNGVIHSICIYGFSFASPTIILELGYTAAEAQLMTIPIYTAGAIVTVVFSYFADRHQTRWFFVVIPFCIACIGFIGLLSIPHPHLPGLTYAFLFFITCGLYPAVICCISWVANNLAPTWKRATGMATLMTLGNLGGAIGSNIFLAHEAPHYWLGYGLSLAILIAGLVCTFVLRFSYKRYNRLRDAVREDEVRGEYTEGKPIPPKTGCQIDCPCVLFTQMANVFLKSNFSIWETSRRYTDMSSRSLAVLSTVPRK